MKNIPTYEGMWWSADETDSKVAGRLISEDGEAVLHLTALTSRTGSFPGRPEYDLIYGSTVDGNYVSLVNCLDMGGGPRSLNAERYNISPTYVLAGWLVPKDQVQGKFIEMRLNWPDLNLWFRHTGIDVSFEDRKVGSFTVKYVGRQPIQFTLSDGLAVQFKFGANALSGRFPHMMHVKDSVTIILKPDQPQDIRYYLVLLEEFKHLLSVCMLEYTEPREVTLIGNFTVRGTGDQPPLTLYMRNHHKPESTQKPHAMDMLLRYDTLQDNFPAVMDGWHRLAAKVSPARSLYFSSLYGQTRYIESIFLSMVQSAEVFHRRYHSGTYMNEEDYRAQILPQLEAAIPKHLSPEFKEALCRKMTYLHEFSLGKRLKLMVLNHKDVFDKYVPSWEKKLQGIVSARNYFTHYSLSASGKPDISDLSVYADILRMLIELEMLVWSGVDPGKLHALAKECEKYKGLFHPSRWAHYI